MNAQRPRIRATFRLVGLFLGLGVCMIVAAAMGDPFSDLTRGALGVSGRQGLYIVGALCVVAGAALLGGFLVGRRRRQSTPPVVAVTVGIDPVSGWWAAAIPTGSRRLFLLGTIQDSDTKLFTRLSNACAVSARARRSLPRATLRDWHPLASGLVGDKADAYKLATGAVAGLQGEASPNEPADGSAGH